MSDQHNNNNKSYECCPKDSWPGIILDSEREYDGKIITIDEKSNLIAYEVNPTTNNTTTNTSNTNDDNTNDDNTNDDNNIGMIVIYDVYGFEGGRIKSVCDSLAREGIHIIMPDIFKNKQGIHQYGGLSNDKGKEWLMSYTWNDVLEPQLDLTYKYMTEILGIKTICVLGFCWGGWVSFRMAKQKDKNNNNKYNIITSCHPSLKIGLTLFNESIIQQCTGFNSEHKILLCPANNDPSNLKKGGQVEQELVKSGSFIKIVSFEDMKHGWVPRGDATTKEVSRDVKIAIHTIGEFVRTHAASNNSS